VNELVLSFTNTSSDVCGTVNDGLLDWDESITLVLIRTEAAVREKGVDSPTTWLPWILVAKDTNVSVMLPTISGVSDVPLARTFDNAFKHSNGPLEYLDNKESELALIV
jgi:hypothetical protein